MSFEVVGKRIMFSHECVTKDGRVVKRSFDATEIVHKTHCVSKSLYWIDGDTLYTRNQNGSDEIVIVDFLLWGGYQVKNRTHERYLH